MELVVLKDTKSYLIANVAKKSDYVCEIYKKIDV